MTRPSKTLSSLALWLDSAVEDPLTPHRDPAALREGIARVVNVLLPIASTARRSSTDAIALQSIQKRFQCVSLSTIAETSSQLAQFSDVFSEADEYRDLGYPELFASAARDALLLIGTAPAPFPDALIPKLNEAEQMASALSARVCESRIGELLNERQHPTRAALLLDLVTAALAPSLPLTHDVFRHLIAARLFRSRHEKTLGFLRPYPVLAADILQAAQWRSATLTASECLSLIAQPRTDCPTDQVDAAVRIYLAELTSLMRGTAHSGSPIPPPQTVN